MDDFHLINKTDRSESFGQKGLSIVDRIGVYLSLKQIKKEIRILSIPFSALDVGCGYNPTLLLELENNLAFGVGIDVKINSEINKKGKLIFFETSIEDALPKLESNQFDLITLISVLEHVWNPEMVLVECNRLLKPNGAIIINVPTWMGKWFLELSAFKFGLSPKIEMDDHKMYYDKQDLWPVIVRSGFKPSWIKMRYHKFGLNLFVSIIKRG